VFNLHGQLADKSVQLYMQIQNEINSDESSIFSHKKYKALLTLAQQQQADTVAQFKEQFNLD